ncbi:hypothetical protein CFY87_06855 [Actinobacillus seminis]|uniref:Trimeric autotransporter adhesin YadA-like head domain-containing protein n=1 Tax=Actinobacillus seminis TaxID=722 RepID=A0ABX4FMD0_9PAST|nr:hypothetical protein CFY87_06855 [Actinobacillus seminis]
MSVCIGGGGKSRVNLLSYSATFSLLSLLPLNAYAVAPSGQIQYASDQGLSISNSLAPGDSHSIAIGGNSLGKRAKALKPGTIAIGWHAIATGKDSTALGSRSTATKEGAIAIGEDTVVQSGANYSTVIGYNLRTESKQITVVGNRIKILRDSKNSFVGGTEIELVRNQDRIVQ